MKDEDTSCIGARTNRQVTTSGAGPIGLIVTADLPYADYRRVRLSKASRLTLDSTSWPTHPLTAFGTFTPPVPTRFVNLAGLDRACASATAAAVQSDYFRLRV